MEISYQLTEVSGRKTENSIMTLFLTASLVPYKCSKEKYNISPAALILLW